MKNLKLYTIDDEYIKYLYSYDDKVMFWEGDNYSTDRKYIGVVLEINSYKYFAPLSSPKDSDYYYINGEKKIRKNTIPIIRLVTDKQLLLGKIKLSNMIPVKDENIALYDINAEKDTKYKDLILDEIICIRKCKKEIMKNAEILYNQKAGNYKNIKYLDSTINFKMLEYACSKYEINKE